MILTTTALLLGACAGTAPVSGQAAASRSIRIDMSDFFFSPTVVDLKPGETVTLLLKNFGTLEHEFMAGRDAVYGQGYEDDWLAKATPASTAGQDMGHPGEAVRIAPSATVTVTLVVPLEGGQFEFGCFLPGHYESGMKGILLVGSASGASTPTAAPPKARVPNPRPRRRGPLCR